MIDFQKVDEAKKILGLEESATLQEIKEAYRRLALKYHPDHCKKEKRKEYGERSKKINQAKDVLLAYCLGYKYSFREEDVKRNTLDKDTYEHLKRFYDGWWADLDL